MSFSYRDENKELNDITRQDLSGSFIELPEGVTHYELNNPEKENTMILVHGESVPYFIYDPTFEFLTGSGVRVLRYDLLGRGFSDRPDTRYNIDLFVKQLADFLDTLCFTRPVNLVGLSTGGPITATFTARNGMLDSFLKIYECAGKMDKPVLLFWGRNDPTVPFKHSDDLRAAMPNVEFHVIENCGHIPHYEKPEEVNPILLEFLRK